MRLRRNKSLPHLLGLVLLLSSHHPTQAQTLEEQAVLAALALIIVRYTTWPSEAQLKEPISFCVIGDNTVQQSFISIDRKTVGDKTLQIINLSRLRNVEECNVLYVSDLQQAILQQLFIELKNHPLLTIGVGFDFAEQGGIVGLENINGKITLHVNQPALKVANLTISARLLKLANIIGN